MKSYFDNCKINLKELFDTPYMNLPDWVDWSWCIYKITNILNNKCYIGQSRNFYARLVGGSSTQFSHLNGFNNHLEEGSRIRLYGALEKYGPENFTVEIIDESPNSDPLELDNLEKYYIDKYNSTNPDNGYNLMSGGTSGTIEYLSSPEVRKVAIKHIIETNTRNGNGDCMYMCHTQEAIDKARTTNARKYGGDPFGQIHTPEVHRKAIYNSSITQCINNINFKLTILESKNLKINPYNYFWNTYSDEYHIRRDSEEHINRICSHLYDDISIELDPRWTNIMSKLFHYFDSFIDYESMINDMTEDMEFNLD